MGTLLNVSNSYPHMEDYWEFVYYRELGINSTHTAPITHQAYSWISITPWCTNYPSPTVGSMIAWNLVAPYYLNNGALAELPSRNLSTDQHRGGGLV
jgi:hypothetical protein